MQGYRKSSHTTYQLHYHFVFIPKYRKPALRGDVAVRLRDMIREICTRNGIEILKGHVRPEHVHLLLSVPPQLSPSRVMQLIKGKTSNRLMQPHPSRSSSSPRKTLVPQRCRPQNSFRIIRNSVLAKYVELQGAVPQDERFLSTQRVVIEAPIMPTLVGGRTHRL